MINQEAIEILNVLCLEPTFLSKFHQRLTQDEYEAVKQLIHTAKNWDEMVNNIPHYWTIDKSYNCEELHKIAEIIKDKGIC